MSEACEVVKKYLPQYASIGAVCRDNLTIIMASMDIILEELKKLNEKVGRLEGQQSSTSQELQKLIKDSAASPETSYNMTRFASYTPKPKQEEIKLADLPEFDGLDDDPETFLDWKRRLERHFIHKGISDSQSFTYAMLKMSKLASLWLDQIQYDRDLLGKPRIDTWSELKLIMTKRFVPRHYKQTLYNQLSSLRQNNKAVTAYIHEFNKLYLACNCNESDELKMARFLNGLNVEIKEKVELQQYFSFDELCSLATKVEAQGKAAKTRAYSPIPYNKIGDNSSHASNQPLIETSKTKQNKEDIKCFKCLGRGHYKSECPNKKAMTVVRYKELEEEETRALLTPDNELQCLEDELKHMQILEPAPDVNTLVLRKVLHGDSSPITPDDAQRENLFHTRCMVNERSCSVIIDSGSCTNAASRTMVEALGLQTRPHPTPYKLNWINNEQTTNVTKQAFVPLEFGEYKDEFWFDILPMTACAILLGRPWQFDRDVVHYCKKNVYSVLLDGKRFALHPLPPKTVAAAPAVPSSSSGQPFPLVKQEGKKDNKKVKKEEKLLNMVKPTAFDVGDFVWLSLHAQKTFDNSQGKYAKVEEGPFKIVHREGYDRFQLMLGDQVATFDAQDLVPCFQYDT